MINEFNVSVSGRPAPQGSKRTGAHGQLLEQSPYLRAWRAAIRQTVYEQYRRMGVLPADLPLLRGPVVVGVTFWLDVPTVARLADPPDLDKLLRATWDALTLARVWEDDSRVVEILHARKAQAASSKTQGADVIVRLAE